MGYWSLAVRVTGAWLYELLEIGVRVTGARCTSYWRLLYGLLQLAVRVTGAWLYELLEIGVRVTTAGWSEVQLFRTTDHLIDEKP